MKRRDEHREAAVGAYRTLEGAELAAAHLVGCGYDEDDVRIAPRDYEVIDEGGLGAEVARWGRWGILGGAAAMAGAAVVSQVGWTELVEAMAPAALWGALIGGLVGIVAAVIAHRVHAAHTYFTAVADLEPTRFEIVAGRDPDRARNDLARWWNPAAPSAGWDPTA